MFALLLRKSNTQQWASLCLARSPTTLYGTDFPAAAAHFSKSATG
jgi:hypothetical protein